MFVRERKLTVLRLSPEVLDRETGRYSESEETEIEISGSLQPVLGEDVQKLSDGYRLVDLKVLFAHVELDSNDVVLYKGNRYKIEHLEEWGYPRPHYRYIIQKEVIR
jgi:hypothetical protein